MIMKHVVKRLAKAAGKSATFMPLPQAVVDRLECLLDYRC